MARLEKVATPALTVAVVVPESCAPLAPVPVAILTVTTVELSVVSVLPLTRMCTTGWVVKAVACAEPAGWVATTSVFCGGGGGDGVGEEPPPPPQPLASNATNKPPPNLRMLPPVSSRAVSCAAAGITTCLRRETQIKSNGAAIVREAVS
jgi:hypothetical protein